MRHLKGGRVLIDSGYRTNVTTYELPLDKETTKAIVEKGLSIIVTEYVMDTRVCVDLIPQGVKNGTIDYHTIANDDGDTIAIHLEYLSDFSDGLLKFSIQ